MSFLYLLLGIGGLLLGAELAVKGSLGMARHWGWPSWLTGLLLMATGTSLPELFVSGAAAAEHPDLALGNIFGSNAFNVGVVLGVLLLIQGARKVPLAGVSPRTGVPLLVGSLAVFWLFGGQTIPVFAGPLLLGGYGFMLAASLGPKARSRWASQQELVDPKAPPRTRSQFWWAVFLTGVGFTLLAIAAGWFLEGALALAAALGWNEGFAGFLITAAGTSAPELVTSLRALRHGHPDAVLGNLLGSNAFNLFLVGGAVALGARAPLGSSALTPQLFINLLAAVVLVAPALLVASKRRKEVTAPAWFGGTLVAAYLAGAWTVYRAG